jgi:hypothetical protein
MNSPLPHGQIQPIDQSYGARKTLNRAYTKIKKHPFGTGVFVNNIINDKTSSLDFPFIYPFDPNYLITKINSKSYFFIKMVS